MLTIRRFQPGDELALWQLFYQTVREVNSADYTPAQVEAWASDSIEMDAWQTHMQTLNPFIAEIEGKIVGYADVQPDGLIDHFFCHKDHQGVGVGKALMNTLFDEGRRLGIGRYHSHVSITAKPFFEHFGFRVVKPQEVTTRGATLVNYLMERMC